MGSRVIVLRQQFLVLQVPRVAESLIISFRLGDKGVIYVVSLGKRPSFKMCD